MGEGCLKNKGSCGIVTNSYFFVSARNSLIEDESEGLCPFVAASWYVELQLVSHCIPFDLIRIKRAATEYNEVFTHWNKRVTSVIEETNKDIIKMLGDIDKSQAYTNYNCYHSIKEDSGVRCYSHSERSYNFYNIKATNTKLKNKKPSLSK